MSHQLSHPSLLLIHAREIHSSTYLLILNVVFLFRREVQISMMSKALILLKRMQPFSLSNRILPCPMWEYFHTISFHSSTTKKNKYHYRPTNLWNPLIFWLVISFYGASIFLKRAQSSPLSNRILPLPTWEYHYTLSFWGSKTKKWAYHYGPTNL